MTQRSSLAAFTGDVVADPHELYDILREHDEIYYDPHDGCWIVTGYEASIAVFTDPRFSSNLVDEASGTDPLSPDVTLRTVVNNQITFMEGERHRAARAVLMRALAPAVKHATITVRAKVAAILTSAREKGEFDIVADLAAPLALYVTADALGIPTDDAAQLTQISSWADTFGAITGGYVNLDMQEVLNLIEYFQELLAAKRREPADDLLSAMINAQDIFPTEADLIANAVMIFAAGQGTSRKLLGTGIPLLLPDWEMWRARVRDDCTWIRPLVDEMLRVVTPARYLVRRAADGADLSQSFPGNHHIQRGERIVVFLDAANRDPTKFENSSRFCPQRHPTSQLNFGAGPHRCPGASLALAEAHVALDMLFEFPSVRPKPNSAPLWNPNRDMGGFASYVVELRA